MELNLLIHAERDKLIVILLVFQARSDQLNVNSQLNFRYFVVLTLQLLLLNLQTFSKMEQGSNLFDSSQKKSLNSSKTTSYRKGK